VGGPAARFDDASFGEFRAKDPCGRLFLPGKGLFMKAMVKHQPPATSQFLTFLLDEQEYGLELFKIQEIRGYAPVTPIPNVPAHVRGVMNLRGTVLPVVDLRMKFRLPPIEYNKFTVIVIAMVGDKMVGLLVDAVSDVLQVTQESMRSAPDFGSAVDTRFIDGVFQTRERLAVALNLEKLLSDIELAVPQTDERGSNGGVQN
jgi:purine-binding chemotaxis protein CheW